MKIFDPQSALAHAGKSAHWAGLRYSSEKTHKIFVRNDALVKSETNIDDGVMCEVLINGHFGYAATADLSEAGLKKAFDIAIATTRTSSRYKLHSFTDSQRKTELGSYESPTLRKLAETPLALIVDCLLVASKTMAIDAKIVNRSAQAMLIQARIDYYTTNGSITTQNFDIVDISLACTAAEGSQSQSRSWNQSGQYGGEMFKLSVFKEKGLCLALESLELLKAQNCPSGTMDLILMPDQMMLQIHESIGHPLELDRILGDERNYAGWSFVKLADFGTLRFGSPLMNVTFDPTKKNALSSYAFDDCGNTAQREILIEGGILKRGLGSLESQARSGLLGVANFRASSWNRAPIDRMANVNLEPGTSTLDEMIGAVENGVLMATNRSWSIDDYRNKFQFGCEYGRLIKNGRLACTVRNPNYRGTTVDFWNRLSAVGQIEETHGTVFCGKGEPGQVIRVGHSSPSCLFRSVEVFGSQI